MAFSVLQTFSCAVCDLVTLELGKGCHDVEKQPPYTVACIDAEFSDM